MQMARMDQLDRNTSSAALLPRNQSVLSDTSVTPEPIEDNASNNSSESIDDYVSSKQTMLKKSNSKELESSAEAANERGNWSGRFDFLMSLLGYSVGLGNVWRFPYLAYSNGGGAFLIPFVIMLILVGIPLMFMELAFGQYANLGPVAVFEKFCPLFHGLGFGMVAVSAIVGLYYNMIIAWTIFYLVASFNSELPWERCNPDWSSHDCYAFKEADLCKVQNGSVYYNATCFNSTMSESYNLYELSKNMTKRPPAEDYFNNYVLGISDGVENMGEIRWQLVLCLLCAWTIVFLCLCKGVKSSGKVVYFTALFPYVVLIILFFRGVTLEGSVDGIIYYLTPKWEKLTHAKVWVDASVQIFFSLSPAWGGLITLASYNKFDNNCFKDSLIVSIGNICTSIFAGFVIFSIIGFLAFELGTDVDKVVDQGAGLAFMVYPEVVTRLPISPLWSVLFFVMLLTLGLGSQMAIMETVMTAVYDRFPHLRSKKTFVVLGISICGFAGGLMLTSQGGMYMLQLMDTYAASWSVFVMAITESVIIGWIYGSERFCKNIEEMIGERSRAFHYIFMVFWRFLSPATLLFLLIFNWIQYKPMEYGKYVYPMWANAIGWILAFVPIIIIVSFGIRKIYLAPPEPILQKLCHLLKPTFDWGPANKQCQYSQAAITMQVKDEDARKNFNVVLTFDDDDEEKA